MECESSSYSPHILIYLEIEEKRVRLADVLSGTATLYEPSDFEYAKNTPASLVFSIDGVERRKDVFLSEGITGKSDVIPYSEVSEVVSLNF